MTFKKIIFIITLFGTIFGLFFIAQAIYRSDKTEVTISTNQNNSKIYINGEKIEGNKIYLKNGKYLVSITKDGYYEYRKNYNIDKKTNNILISLNKIADKQISLLVYSGEHKNVIARYPIVNKLPYSNLFLDINYSDDSTLNYFKLSVKAYEGYRQSVITKIKQWGYNPAEFNIEFKDYENPFKL